ncbi:nitric oxide reductase activation protein NorD [Streptomyces sp. cg40]|uniref:nitric oxide reductase activation protein NorD n=1 Tax=Streptomyces sp. cg40 TaxID=3419764 RepID=UPI003D04CD8E
MTGRRVEHLKRYELLAHAVLGRPVVLALTDDDRAFTDGSTIFLPDHCDDDLRCALVVQAGLLAIGSLRRAHIAPVTGRHRGALEGYLLLEVCRAAHTARTLPPRVATRIRAVYDGPVTTSAEESAAVATSRAELPTTPHWFGRIKVRSLDFGAVTGADTSPAGSSGAASGPEEPDDPDDEEQTENSRIADSLMSPLGSAALAKALAKLLGTGSKRRSSSGDAGHELAVVGGRDRRGRAAARRLRGAAALLRALTGPPVVGTRYPEWDCGTGGYREAWCTVLDLDPSPSGDRTSGEPAADVRLRRELARLGTALQRRRHLREGDSLDMSALVDVEIDRRLGDQTEPRAFESQSRTGRDLGVLILLDATGSAAEIAENHTIFEDQRQLVHRLTRGFEELGDRVGAYGFYSRGRENVRFLRIKEFDGRYDQAAQARLAALQPAGFTRLGAAVRHATGILARGAGTSNLLLVVVGDGLPYDHGYEDHYAREDSRTALREALLAGVGCVSLGIRSSVDPRTVEHVWSEVTHLQLENAGELTRTIRPVLAEALRLAGARRRPHRLATTDEQR